MFAAKATIGKVVKKQYLLHMSSQYGERVGPLTAETGSGVWVPQQISTVFTSWLRYCTDITQWRSAKLCTMFGRLLGWYTIGCKVCFASKSCILLYWQRYCTALEEWASAKLSGVVSLRDRAAIPLGGRLVYLPSSLLTSRNAWKKVKCTLVVDLHTNIICILHCVSKKRPTLTCYNLDIHIFSLKHCMLLCQRTHKTHSNYHLVAAELPFIPKVIKCMHETIKTYLEREHSILLSVTRTLYVYPVFHGVGRCVKAVSYTHLTLPTILRV